jgi:signal transduction histidine kinase
MARVDSLSLSGRQFTVIGGVRIGNSFLSRMARGEQLEIYLEYPGGIIGRKNGEDGLKTGKPLVRKLEIPLLDTGAGEITSATLVLTHRLLSLRVILGRINRWFLVMLAAAALISVFVVSWLARTISRPLEQLSDKASRLDLDNLEIEFKTGRGDEIGKLSGVLDSMAARLKRSSAMIRDAERRATLGEMARQVNHDIKNGLAPIRNIFRHLSRLAGKDSGELGRTFTERKGSLESSIDYLQELASRYAALTPPVREERFGINGVVKESLRIIQDSDRIKLTVDLGREAEIAGDPIALRRVMENLLKNAREALGPDGGEVAVSTSIEEPAEGPPSALISVSDTGEGMSGDQRARIFEDFYTTREDGTGLGLSIVQRLIRDLGGSVTVESEKGLGTVFILKLPLEGER